MSQAARIEDAKLSKETLDALGDPCIHHRTNLSGAQKDAVVATLTAQGLGNPADAAAIKATSGLPKETATLIFHRRGSDAGAI